MKKIASLLIAVVLFVLPFSLCANAANLSDGTYEVPVVLMHKEDEKESFGNKYVAQTALLKVSEDQKTVTILLTTNMKGIEFSYYTNGSLEGDVSEGTPVSNIEVAGETYKQGFEIPVMADGDIGLQFSVPVMPMSPSARLRIDYDKAVLISSSVVTDSSAAGTFNISNTVNSDSLTSNTDMSAFFVALIGIVILIILCAVVFLLVGGTATLSLLCIGASGEEKNNDDK